MADRLVIVDELGKVYERWDIDIRIQYQDEGHTLKIFVTPKDDTEVDWNSDGGAND